MKMYQVIDPGSRLASTERSKDNRGITDIHNISDMRRLVELAEETEDLGVKIEVINRMRKIIKSRHYNTPDIDVLIRMLALLPLGSDEEKAVELELVTCVSTIMSSLDWLDIMMVRDYTTDGSHARLLLERRVESLKASGKEIPSLIMT